VRILFLDQFSDPGGAQQVLLELLPAIRARGWEALVALPGDGALFRQVRSLGFETAPVACGPYRSGRKTPADMMRMMTQLPRLAMQIRELANRLRADLVYINGPRLLPGAAMAGLRAPVLFHAHSYVLPGASRQMAGLALRTMRARIVGSCRFVADLWRGYVAPPRISVIYNGVAKPGANLQRAARDYTIGCIGRISPEKGQREFVAAASAICHALPNARFVIYGAPLFADHEAVRYHEEVRAAAAGLPIEFAGWVDSVGEALSTLDLLLVPSAPYEATPRVIMEAFAAGVPVMAFPSGGIPELIDDDRTGFLARSGGEMARRAIELLTNNRDRLAAVSGAAGSVGRTRFSLARFHREVLDVMESAVS
jgi:glycosyltransferase involved in cell wall biosynthesis